MIIGLTGGIGSGKSTALDILKKNGYKTVSCDDITRELYRKRKTLKKLRGEFPSAIKGRFFLKADDASGASTGPRPRQGSVKNGQFCAQGYRPRDR